MSIGLSILYVLHVTRSAIQGMGNTVMPMVSGIAELAVRMTCAVVLPMLLGDMGILYSEALAGVGAVCVLIPSYLVCIKKLEHKILQNP
jgi:peptidoglycan biosynthesis protein MviN/MurJ (putative lipid II flippase)